MQPIQEGTKGVITYYAKKHGKYVSLEVFYGLTYVELWKTILLTLILT
jgi:hypothetical protein